MRLHIQLKYVVDNYPFKTQQDNPKVLYRLKIPFWLSSTLHGLGVIPTLPSEKSYKVTKKLLSAKKQSRTLKILMSCAVCRERTPLTAQHRQLIQAEAF